MSLIYNTDILVNRQLFRQHKIAKAADWGIYWEACSFSFQKVEDSVGMIRKFAVLIMHHVVLAMVRFGFIYPTSQQLNSAWAPIVILFVPCCAFP